MELRLQPREDKFYSIEIVNDPRGLTRIEQVNVSTTNPNDPNQYQEIRSVTSNALRFSLQFAQRFGPFIGRFGLKESTGGVGLDLLLLDDAFELRQDLFGFGEVVRPRWRLSLGYAFLNRLWLMGGVDDIMSVDRREYFRRHAAPLRRRRSQDGVALRPNPLMHRILGDSLLAAALVAALGICGRGWAAAKRTCRPQLPGSPSVRLYFLSNVAGALEPCGCRKDMLGGVDHAAAFLAAEQAVAPHRLLLRHGPTLVSEPELDPERREQDLWKARGARRLPRRSAARRLGAGRQRLRRRPESAQRPGGPVGGKGRRQQTSRCRSWCERAVRGGRLQGRRRRHRRCSGDIAASPDAARALEGARAELAEAGAQIKVALIAAGRGDALRLVEKVTGFDVAAIGKASDQGDANDAPSPPTLVGDTLVVQAPNHLQALAYVDLFVKDNGFDFADASYIAERERLESLIRRREDLDTPPRDSARTGRRREHPFAARRSRKTERRERRARAQDSCPDGAYRQLPPLSADRGARRRGSEPAVAKRMLDYYRRVNDHNRVALKDRVPAPAPSGTSRYLGNAACDQCHSDESTFWQGTGHATAYATLSDEFKEFNLDCVGCHVTGYNRPGGSTVTHVEDLKNVQCEACHGPGSRHVETAGNTALITLTPPDATCRACHHPPHVADDWDLKAAWQKIIGPGHGQPVTPH